MKNEYTEVQKEIIRNCEEQIAHLGKFEREARYIPYYYEMYLNGDGETICDCENCARDYDDDYPCDDCDNYITQFDVMDDDVILFPELKGRKHVAFYESNDGFITEV